MIRHSRQVKSIHCDIDVEGKGFFTIIDHRVTRAEAYWKMKKEVKEVLDRMTGRNVLFDWVAPDDCILRRIQIRSSFVNFEMDKGLLMKSGTKLTFIKEADNLNVYHGTQSCLCSMLTTALDWGSLDEVYLAVQPLFSNSLKVYQRKLNESSNHKQQS